MDREKTQVFDFKKKKKRKHSERDPENRLEPKNKERSFHDSSLVSEDETSQYSVENRGSQRKKRKKMSSQSEEMDSHTSEIELADKTDLLKIKKKKKPKTAPAEAVLDHVVDKNLTDKESDEFQQKGETLQSPFSSKTLISSPKKKATSEDFKSFIESLNLSPNVKKKARSAKEGENNTIENTVALEVEASEVRTKRNKKKKSKLAKEDEDNATENSNMLDESLGELSEVLSKKHKKKKKKSELAKEDENNATENSSMLDESLGELSEVLSKKHKKKEKRQWQEHTDAEESTSSLGGAKTNSKLGHSNGFLKTKPETYPREAETPVGVNGVEMRGKKKKKLKHLSTADPKKEDSLEVRSPQTPLVYGNTQAKMTTVAEPSSDGDVAGLETPKNQKKRKKRKSEAACTSGSESFDRSDSTDRLEISMLDEEEDGRRLSRFNNDDVEKNRVLLEEFLPNARRLSESTIMYMAKYDLPRFQNFKEQGSPIRFGRFTSVENEQLKKNVESFLEQTGIESAEKLFVRSNCKEEEARIRKIKSDQKFWKQIAEGIPRPWKQVFMRAKKMFNTSNYKGRYTEEEVATLKKYHTLYGNKWEKIAELVSRSSHSVILKMSQLEKSKNFGPWTKEERVKLMRGVEEIMWRSVPPEEPNDILSKNKQDILEIARTKLYSGISWVEVARAVGTRNPMQCRHKWGEILTKKMTKGEKVYQGWKRYEAKAKLIRKLYSMKVEDMNEVNWEELADAIG
ncbi:transcription termination factor 1 isoform X2 [Latimeria chalumnae]|nr:PREDICTED: transcription termination factor 1 isoform X2 [Latimeria chalumnae]|eukprot:XP_014341643.1 PREDICTED: transcription termination factor 1 isoform X2 [Latimeria chalumnae]